MSKLTDKSRQTNTTATANLASPQHKSENTSLLQEMADNSPQVQQLQAYQLMADKKMAGMPTPGMNVVQRMTIDEYSAWITEKDGLSIDYILEEGYKASGDGEVVEEKMSSGSAAASVLASLTATAPAVSETAAATAASSTTAATPVATATPASATAAATPVATATPASAAAAATPVATATAASAAASSSSAPASREARWREARLAEIRDILSRVKLADFESTEKIQKSTQMIIGGLVRGKPLMKPPSPQAILAKNGMLFRGSTIDASTKKLYAGSSGSKEGTPTTPSPVIAALFAAKSAKENGAEGRIVYGAARNVESLGFAAPDVMAGQEQEVTVKASPTATNSALGGDLKLETFIAALAVIDENVPLAIVAGMDFDNRLEKATRQGLSPQMEQRLMYILNSKSVDDTLRAWKEAKAKGDELSGKLTSFGEMIDRKEKGHVVDPARTEVTKIRAKIGRLKSEPLLDTYNAILNEVRGDIEGLSKMIAGLEPKPKAAAEQVAEDDDDNLNLFD
jgi:hypothetical protein